MKISEGFKLDATQSQPFRPVHTKQTLAAGKACAQALAREHKFGIAAMRDAFQQSLRSDALTDYFTAKPWADTVPAKHTTFGQAFSR